MKKYVLWVLLVFSFGVVSCGTNGGTSTDSTTGTGSVSGSGQ
ncbi:MAG: hypothetical protein Q8P84_09415 [Deltaproteobacteria bacterium]|nr:hypothetical protein [Deltaproteobacteria bacterium]